MFAAIEAIRTPLFATRDFGDGTQYSKCLLFAK